MNKTNIFSCIAIILSITACIITWLRINVTITNNTFVGIMAGFMGACATIIVGVQIYNSIETSRKIKELENLQHKINSDIEFLKEEREKSIHNTRYGLNHALGISCSMSGNKFFAFDAFFIALKESLILDNTLYINSVLGNIEALCERMKIKPEITLSKVFNIEKYNPDNLKDYNSFKLIESRYVECYRIAKDTYEKCIKQSQAAK